RNYYYRVLRKCRRAVSDSEVHYILRHVHNFASLQRVAVAFRDALPLFERGDLVGVRNTLGSALNGTTRDLRGGIKYFSTIKERVYSRMRTPPRTIRTLITPLDKYLRGHGLRQNGDTGIVLA